MVFIFPYRGHLQPLLSVFLGFFFFEDIVNEIIFPIFFLNLFVVGVLKDY
jgi:hypothetical protein